MKERNGLSKPSVVRTTTTSKPKQEKSATSPGISKKRARCSVKNNASACSAAHYSSHADDDEEVFADLKAPTTEVKNPTQFAVSAIAAENTNSRGLQSQVRGNTGIVYVNGPDNAEAEDDMEIVESPSKKMKMEIGEESGCDGEGLLEDEDGFREYVDAEEGV